jgi:hypothetical protein
MVVPTKAYDTPAATALKKSEDIAEQLESVVSANSTATAQFQRPDFTKTQNIEKPTPEPEGDELLDIIQGKLDTALGAGDKDAVERLVAEGKAALVKELMTREKSLARAQEAYDKALDEFGAAAPATAEAKQVLERWKESYKGYESFVPEQEAYYEGLIADVAALREPNIAYSLEDLRQKTREELLSIFDTAVETYKARIQEIQAEKLKVVAGVSSEKQQKIDAIKAKIT